MHFSNMQVKYAFDLSFMDVNMVGGCYRNWW